MNPVDIITLILAFLTIARILTRLTPTGKDDEVVEKIRKFVEDASHLWVPDMKK